MTLFEWFLLLPLWARVIICIILIYLIVEALLMPYRANLMNKRYKDIQKTLEAILEASTINTKQFEDTQRVMGLLLGIIGTQRKDKKDE